ncbi:MAG: hypothetical protein JW928_06395, partial [Candidatus Aureabacteria bacterium]|nr:hypothetical protein [Candidatus Auribacterota bacterium]
MNWNKKKILAGFFPGVLILLFILTALSSSLDKSATFDEVHYLGIGKSILKNRSFEIQGARLHPPLFFYIASLPLTGIDISENILKISDPILRGQNILFLRPHDLITVLVRLPFIAAGGLLLLA